MRQIDNMTPAELDILVLKGMLRDSKPAASVASGSNAEDFDIRNTETPYPDGFRLDDNNTETPTL